MLCAASLPARALRQLPKLQSAPRCNEADESPKPEGLPGGSCGAQCRAAKRGCSAALIAGEKITGCDGWTKELNECRFLRQIADGD